MKRYKIMTPKGECLAECEGSSQFMGIPTWKINGYNYSHILIKELGLAVEEVVPEKKKLYALSHKSGEIKFSVDGTKRCCYEPSLWELAPQYDIEYDK